MNFLFEIGLFLDAIGMIGLGLLALAAIDLARNSHSWGGGTMAAGAISLLLARIYLVISPHFVTSDWLAAIGPVGTGLSVALPPILLTFGLAGIVWGLWGHQRWLNR